MAKKKAEAAVAAEPDAVELPAIPGTEAVIEAHAPLGTGWKTEIPVTLNVKCSVPFAVGDCIAVVTLPDGMNLEKLAYAIRHGYAGATE